MTKHKAASPLGDELIASLQEGIDILEGKAAPSRFYPAPAAIGVRAIRAKLKLSQAEFAQRFGFSIGTLRGWEQGHRQPDSATRTLLLVIDQRPEVIDEVLAADQRAMA